MTFVADKHLVLNGMATVLRTTQSGDVWQFRMYIPDEGRHFRKSLKTRDLPTALQRATEEALKIYSDLRSGRKIFSSTVKDLIDEYLAFRSRDVSVGDITAGRLVTIKSQLAHLAAIVGETTRVSELDRDSLYDWYVTRKERNPTVQKVTVRNEQATINHLVDFSYQKGLIQFPKFNFRPIRIRQSDIGKRGSFSYDEYDKLCGYMRSWASKKNSPSDEAYRRRNLIRNYVLISANSLMRVGELRQLLWGDVNIFPAASHDEKGRAVTLTRIRVRAETSKVRAERDVIVRGGEYFKRQKELSFHTDHDSLVFSFNGKDMISPREWGVYWLELMNGIGIENWQERKLTWYSLRHFGITCRIRAGVNIVALAKVAGTSVNHIENTYLKFTDDMSINVALKNFSITSDGVLSSI